MTYDEWERTLPAEMKGESAWRVQAFRLEAFLGDCTDGDTDAAITDPRYVEPATQLCGAAGSIGANLCEGYARLSRGDRIRFYEYALGSLAETKNWYLKIRRTLDPVVLAERFALLHSITRLTLAMIRSERAKAPPKPVSSRRRT